MHAHEGHFIKVNRAVGKKKEKKEKLQAQLSRSVYRNLSGTEKKTPVSLEILKLS